MLKKAALALSLLLSVFAVGSSAASGVDEIPFFFTDGFICLQAHLAQSTETLNFLLDSGAGASVLDIRTARRLHLKMGAPQTVQGVGSEAVAYRMDGVKASTGNVCLANLPLAVDLSKADTLCDRPIDGLIGIDFFKDRVVQIDYVKHCLRLLKPGKPAPQAVVERLPMKMQNGIVCVPVGVNESKPRWTRLDTGCNDALHWVVPRPLATKAPREVSIGFVTDDRDTALTSVTLGGRTMSNVKTALHGEFLFPGEAGLLGNGVLSQYLVTVDWPHHEVRLQDRVR